MTKLKEKYSKPLDILFLVMFLWRANWFVPQFKVRAICRLHGVDSSVPVNFDRLHAAGPKIGGGERGQCSSLMSHTCFKGFQQRTYIIKIFMLKN